MQNAANQIGNTVTANQGNLQNISNQVSGMLPGLQSMVMDQSKLQPGLGYINQSLSGKYLNSNPANSQLAKIGSGSMLNSNPYTTAMAKQAGQDALNGVNSSFSLAGRTGGGNNIERAAQGVAQAENQVMFGNYQNERALQQQALGMQSNNYNTALGAQSQAASMLPSYQAAQYAGVPAYLGAAQTAAQLPYTGIQNLGQIGGILGGHGTSTSSGSQPGGWGTQLAGAAASALPFILSDRRAKENIEKVGERNGLGIFEWTYKAEIGIPGRFRGVIAQEVAEKMPWMLGPEINGLMTVRYTPERVA